MEFDPQAGGCGGIDGEINHFNVTVTLRDRNTTQVIGTSGTSSIGTSGLSYNWSTSTAASDVDFEVSISGDIHQDSATFSMSMNYSPTSCG